MFTARRQFDGWQSRQRHKFTPLPEEFWQKAVGLACKHGLNKAACVLGLKYDSLKKHLAGTATKRSRKAAISWVLAQRSCFAVLWFVPASVRDISSGGRGFFLRVAEKSSFFERNQVWTGNIIQGASDRIDFVVLMDLMR